MLVAPNGGCVSMNIIVSVPSSYL